MTEFRTIKQNAKREVEICWCVDLFYREPSSSRKGVIEQRFFDHEPSENEVFECLARLCARIDVPNCDIHADVRKEHTIVDDIIPDQRG